MRPAAASALLTTLVAILLAAPLGGCLAGDGRVTSVVAIPVAEGVNAVPRFAPDGRQGLIVGGSEQGAGHPDTFLVMLPRLTPRGWDVVSIADRDSGRITPTLADTVGRARDVRFARAKIGGTPATLMFVASGDAGPRPVTVSIDTYRLTTDGEDGSGLASVFDPIDHIETERRYCSPAAALDDVERLPRAPDSTLPPTRDGCADPASS